MTKDNNTTNDLNKQSLDEELADLISEVKKVNQEILDIGHQSEEKLNDIEKHVDESVGKLEQIYTDLDKIEKDAGDELDKLILQQAEDLASE